MKRPLRWYAWRASALGLGVLLLAAADGCAAFGSRASGLRREHVQRSPHWGDGEFVNPQPLINDKWGSVTAMFHASPDAHPNAPMPLVTPDPKSFATPPASGLRVTWLGHSTTLLEVDGQRILTDPVWSGRASPYTWVGPERWYAPPIALADLPPIDAVVISHDHYDHLDMRTIQAMAGWTTTKFIVPLGVGADLAAWGIPEASIVELDWWQHTKLHDLDVACVPARHASGRFLLDNDQKLWAGYAFVGGKHRVYYSGDTGLFPALADIGERLGPFDLTMIEVGQYHAAWPDWHMGPEQAVTAHQMVRGKVLLPVHWGAITLAPHAWTEPIERAWAAAQLAHVTMVSPQPGESVDPDAPPAVRRWWPALPWRTAAEDPIQSSQMK